MKFKQLLNTGATGTFLEHGWNKTFQDIKIGDATYSKWYDILPAVSRETYQYSHKYEVEQTPVYTISLEDVPTVVGSPKKQIEVSLQQALREVANARSFSDSERIDKSNTLLSKYFDENNAMVEVVGLDRTTIIQNTNIKQYLRRVATEEDLANITILEQKKNNNNKFIYLKVHELYVEPRYE